MPKTKNTKKKLSLSTLIFTALLLGALFGVGLHYLIPAGHIRDDIIIEGMLYVVGQGFIRLMQMLVVPLVFCSLVCGSMAIGDTKTLGKVGIKTVLFYLFTTAMAVTVALSVASLINPGLGVKVDNISTSEVSLSESKPLTEILLNIIPKNPIECFGVYQILLFLFTRLNPMRFIKKFFPVMSFAFTTATSNATIPLSIDTLHKKIGVSKKISSFTIPLGATVNMDGTSIMQGVAVIFIAQVYGISLTPSDLLTVVATATLASIGTAGVPSVGLVTLAMVLQSVGLPTEGIALIMGIDRILDMLRTAVNITGDAVCTTIVAHQEKALDRTVFNEN